MGFRSLSEGRTSAARRIVRTSIGVVVATLLAVTLCLGTSQSVGQSLTSETSAPEGSQVPEAPFLLEDEQSDLWYRRESKISLETVKRPADDLVNVLNAASSVAYSVARAAPSLGAYLSEPQNALHILWAGGCILVICLLAFAGLRLLGRVRRARLEAIKVTPAPTGLIRVWPALVRIGLNTVGRLVLLAAGILILLVLPLESEPFRALVIILWASVLYRLSMAVLEELFSIHEPSRRLIPCSDVLAAHFFYSIRRIAAYIIFFYIVINVLQALHYREDFIELLGLIYRAGTVLLIVLVFAKRDLVLAQMGEGEGVANRWIRWLASNIYGFILLVVALFIINSLGYVNLTEFLITSVIFTFLACTLAFNAYKYLDRAFHRMFLERERAARMLDLKEETARRAYSVSTAILRYAILASLVLLLLSIWGVNLGHLGIVFSLLGHPLFKVGETPVSLVSILQVAVILVITALISRYMRKLLERGIILKAKADASVWGAVSRFLHYTIIAVGAIIALQVIGIDLSALTVFAGALGIGLGFGLQNTAHNFVSGIILLAERTIKEGDFIEVGQTLGRVLRMSVRSTVVRNIDNICVIVPNSNLAANNVTNWSYEDPRTRLRIPVGVSYGSDVELVRRVLLDVAAALPEVLKSPPPDVYFRGFGDSSLNFELLAWTDRPYTKEKIISNLNFDIVKGFREHGVQIPFPQRDLHIRSSIPIETLLERFDGSEQERSDKGK